MANMQSVKIENSYRNILQLALPIGISILIPQLNLLTNTLFLGAYTPTHGALSTRELLGASGIAGIYYLTLVMIGYGLVAGLLMFMSRKAGEDDLPGMGKLFSTGIWLCLSLVTGLVLISILFTPVLFRYAIHDDAIRAAALSFIQIRYWGLPFVILYQLSNSLFIASGQSKRIIIGSVVQTIVNIVFDYLFIFGIGIFPEMGLNGTALSSIISELAYMLVGFGMIFTGPAFVSYNIHVWQRPDLAQMKLIFFKSFPLIFQNFLSIGAWEVFFLYIEHLGKAESAVSQILRSVFGVVGVAAWALASTCNSMVSNLLGQGQSEEVIPLIKKIILVSFSVAFVLGIAIFLFPSWFLSLMTNDIGLVETGAVSMRIVVMATWMLSVSTICFHGVVGTGNTKMNMVFEIIAIVFYLVYVTIVVEVMHLPLAYAWASEFVYWLSLFAMSAWYLKRGAWRTESALPIIHN